MRQLMDKIDLLLGRMLSGAIISGLVLTDNKIDDALTERENNSFATRWMDSFQKLKSEKAANSISKDADPRVSMIREAAYLQSYRKWKSPDLAAYISDDFGL